DSLDMIRGKHDFKFGIGIRANQMNVGTEAFQGGFWIPGAIGNFSGYASTGVSIPGNPTADFLMGLVGVSFHDQTYNGPVTGRRWKIYRPFVQDDWRITKDLTLNLGLAWDITNPISEEIEGQVLGDSPIIKDLTLNLGLAWDITNPISEVAGRMANYDPYVNKLFVAGQNGVSQSAEIEKSWTAFEPRLGLAWKVLGSDKTAVRAGYAIYHDSAWRMGPQGLWP